MIASLRNEEGARCSFCDKGRDEVAKMIAGGPNVFICDECVDICVAILAKEFAAEGGRRLPASRSTAFTGLSCGLCRSEVHLGEFVNVPDRGLVCLACLNAVRAVIEPDDG